MKLFALAVILVCCLVRAHCDFCSADQIQTVQQQFATAFADEGRLREFGQACFERMIAQNPDAYPSGQGEAAAQRINQRLAVGIRLLDNPEELARRIAEIRGSGRFNPQLYAAHLRNILHIMPEYVGDSYDAGAWLSCLTWLGRQVTQS